MVVGIVPVNVLFSRLREIKCLKYPIEEGIVPVNILVPRYRSYNCVKYPTDVGIDPDRPSRCRLIDWTLLLEQVTPVQLQYDMTGDLPEHSHPEYPAADTCIALARLHIASDTISVVILMTEVPEHESS